MYAFLALKGYIPDLNEREQFPVDFNRIRREQRLIVNSVRRSKPFVSSYELRDDGRGVIRINADLRGVYRQYYLWYELGRHFLGGVRPLEEYWKLLRLGKDKFEADILPLMAMLPRPYIPNIIGDYAFANSFYRFLIKKRLYLFNYWNDFRGLSY